MGFRRVMKLKENRKIEQWKEGREEDCALPTLFLTYASSPILVVTYLNFHSSSSEYSCWSYFIPLFISHCSIALVVDNPDLLSRLAETFISRAAIRFIIILWGEKSSIDGEVIQCIPIFDYKEILRLGQDSREALIASCNKGNSIHWHWWKIENGLQYFHVFAWITSLVLYFFLVFFNP